MSDMIEVKTSELEGKALDWAVALAEGYQPLLVPTGRSEYSVGVILSLEDGPRGFACRYSVDWNQGGPLIEKHTSTVTQSAYNAGWWAHSGNHLGEGKTPLIAACRAIVSAKLGDTVSVPAELLNHA